MPAVRRWRCQARRSEGRRRRRRRGPAQQQGVGPGVVEQAGERAAVGQVVDAGHGRAEPVEELSGLRVVGGDPVRAAVDDGEALAEEVVEQAPPTRGCGHGRPTIGSRLRGCTSGHFWKAATWWRRLVLAPGRRVARRRAARRIGRCGRAAGHQPADRDGDLHHPAGVRAPFRLVGVQQPVVGVAPHDEGELPGQVGRVADAGAHALSDERRGQVGRVAEQEQPPVAPAVGDGTPEGVGGLPQEGQLVHIHPGQPRPDQLEDLGVVEVLGSLAGAQPELPPVAAGHDRHEGGGPVGVAQTCWTPS